jgi:hypothetical protein
MIKSIIETDNGGFHKIVITGRNPGDLGWLMHQEVLSVIKRLSGEKLLIDITALEGRPNIVKSIQVADSIRKEAKLDLHKMAIVEREENKATASDEELVLANRGLPIRFFFNEEGALKWLME